MNHQLRHNGFTLIELMTAFVATSILLVGLTSILSNSQKAFNQTEDQLFGDVATDSYGAQRLFEHLVRMSTQKYCEVQDTDLAVFYYSTSTVSLPDRYARFFWSGTPGDGLMLTTGELSSPGEFDSWEAGNTRVIASDVSDCHFVQYGATLRMYLTVDDKQHEVSISTSATRQNKS